MDAARIVAVLAIVWLHTPRSQPMLPTVSLSRFAVPFFVSAAVFLMLKGVVTGSRRPFLA